MLNLQDNSRPPLEPEEVDAALSRMLSAEEADIVLRQELPQLSDVLLAEQDCIARRGDGPGIRVHICSLSVPNQPLLYGGNWNQVLSKARAHYDGKEADSPLPAA